MHVNSVHAILNLAPAKIFIANLNKIPGNLANYE